MKGMLLFCSNESAVLANVSADAVVFYLSFCLCPLTHYLVLITLNMKGTLLEAQKMSAE